jgi:flagellar motor component MotA
MKNLLTALLSLTLIAGGAASGWAQGGAKEDIKEAGHATKKAVTKTGSAIKKGTKKVVHAGAKQTRKGAAKVEEKTDKK